MEEEMMTRVPLSKEEAKKLKQQQRSNMAGARRGEREGGRSVGCKRREVHTCRGALGCRC